MALTRIETDLIADSSITADKIASSAVTQTKIDSSVELGGGLDVIVDKFTGNGSTTQYSITETPTDEDKTIVIIEGVVQLKNSYSVSGNVVTFSSAIPNNYNFEIISFAGSGGGGGGSGPKITTVEVTNSGGTVLDDTAVDIAGGHIKITGTGFVTGCQVIVNNVAATSTTFVSSTVVRAQLPATAAGTYFVYVVNPDGGVAIKINGVTFSSSPTWVTGSTLSGFVDQAISVQLNATDATTYTLQSGSTLPTGVTLTSGGLLSGTVTGITQETVYSFTIIATDAQNQDSARTFNLTISNGRVFTISPAVSGISTWTLETDGAINLSTSGTWTIVPSSNFTVSAKIWGAGGGAGTQNGTGGGGGCSTGTVSLSSGVSYTLIVGGSAAGAGASALGGGGVGDVNRGNGGGYSGIFRTSISQANTVLMAGGGGGGGGGTGSGPGGAGGGTNGQAGNGGSGAQPGGGTQSAGGAGTGASSSASGSALTGANGLSGGGGGYFGGASGGDNGTYAPGAGGGSGYINLTYVTGGITYTGSGSTPGNSSDANRGTSGNGRAGSAGAGNAGRIYFN